MFHGEMSENVCNNWGKIFIDTYRNPLKKLELPGNKLLVPSGAEDEATTVEQSLNMLADALNRQRVERRCSRSTAIWLPEENLAKILQIHGNLGNFGFANKEGKFLHPQETLFLLETNRLELLWENVPVSIQQAYEILLKKTSLSKYIAYKRLALQGFKLSPMECTTERSCEDEPAPKRFKYNNEHGAYCDFKVTLPDKSKSNRTAPDFNLHICNDKYIPTKMDCTSNDNVPKLLSYSGTEFSGFYCVGNVNLPNL